MKSLEEYQSYHVHHGTSSKQPNWWVHPHWIAGRIDFRLSVTLQRPLALDQIGSLWLAHDATKMEDFLISTVQVLKETEKSSVVFTIA